MVSVSRRAAPPHFGHVTLTNSGTSSSGERPVPGDLDVRRQHHRQLLFGHRHHAALRAVDHRDRRAPVALPRDAPVLDAESDRGLAEAFALGLGASYARAPRRSAARAIRPNSRRCRRPGTRPSSLRVRRQFAIHRADHRTDRNAVFACRIRNRARRAPGTAMIAPVP